MSSCLNMSSSVSTCSCEYKVSNNFSYTQKSTKHVAGSMTIKNRDTRRKRNRTIDNEATAAATAERKYIQRMKTLLCNEQERE